jgi:hypothetical protein
VGCDTISDGEVKNQTTIGSKVMAKITIDDKEYDTESMSEKALQQVQSLQYVNGQLMELQLRAAALQTARNAYANALKGILEDGEEQDADAANVSLPDKLNFD